MRYMLLVLALLVLEPFTRETNFMSLEGYARWQRFTVTRTWGPR